MKDEQLNTKEGEEVLSPPPARSNINREQIIDGDDEESSLRIGCLQEQQQLQQPQSQSGSRLCAQNVSAPVHPNVQHQIELSQNEALSARPRTTLRHTVSRGDQPIATRRRSFLSQVRCTLQETWRAVGLPSSRRRSRQVADVLANEGDMDVDGDKVDRDIETASYYTGEDTKAKKIPSGPSAWIITPMASSVSPLGGTYARFQDSTNFSVQDESISEPIDNPPAQQIRSLPGAFRLRPGDHRMRPAGIEQSSSSSVQSSDAPSIQFSSSNSIIPDSLNRNNLFQQDSATFFVPRANVIDDASVTPDPIALFDVYHASPLDTSISLDSLEPEDAVILSRRVVKCFVIGILFILLSLGTALYAAMKANKKNIIEATPPLKRPEFPSASFPIVNVSDIGLSATDVLPDNAIDYDFSATNSGSNTFPSLDALLDAEKTLLPETVQPSAIQSNPQPTLNPTVRPTVTPTTLKPTDITTYAPTTITPTVGWTSRPTNSPSAFAASASPSQSPSTVDKLNLLAPVTSMPTQFSGHLQSYAMAPATVIRQPTNMPSTQPSGQPSETPSLQPSLYPSQSPSRKPSPSPTPGPTSEPTPEPTLKPTLRPTIAPISFTSDIFTLTSEPTSLPIRPSQSNTDDDGQQQAQEQPGNNEDLNVNENPVSLAVENPTNAPTETVVSVATVTAETASAAISASDEIDSSTPSNESSQIIPVISNSQVSSSSGSNQSGTQGNNNDEDDDEDTSGNGSNVGGNTSSSSFNGSTTSHSQGDKGNDKESGGSNKGKNENDASSGGDNTSSNGSNSGGNDSGGSSNGSSNSGSQSDKGNDNGADGSNKDKGKDKNGDKGSNGSNDGSDKDSKGSSNGKDDSNKGEENNKGSGGGGGGGKT